MRGSRDTTTVDLELGRGVGAYPTESLKNDYILVRHIFGHASAYMRLEASGDGGRSNCGCTTALLDVT